MPTTKSSAVDAAARRRSKQFSPLRIKGGYAAVLLLLVVFCTCLILKPSPMSGAWLWVAALFILGMPHGAYDLAAIWRTSPNWRIIAQRFAAYTLVLMACVGAYFAVPATTVICFLFLAAHHFGISDSVWTRGRVGLAWGDHLVGLGRGLVVLFSPFAFQPSASVAPFASIVRLVRPLEDPLPATVAILAAVLMLLGVGLVLAASLRSRCNGLVEEWTTLGAVVALSVIAPPLVAIGSYFLAIHAFGHCLRAFTPGRPVHSRHLANAVRVHWESVPLLVPSVIIVLVVAVIVSGADNHAHGNRADAIALSFLIFCVVATLPHHMLWMASGRWSAGITRSERGAFHDPLARRVPIGSAADRDSSHPAESVSRPTYRSHANNTGSRRDL